MIDLLEYIKLPKTERQKHLDLADPCQHRGTNSTQCRALLAYFLDTNVPSAMSAHCCHACNDGACSNPKHLYWGTPSENALDRRSSKTYDQYIGKIAAAQRGDKNANFGLKPWENWKATDESLTSWSMAHFIYVTYFLQNWDFDKYGQGKTYFWKKYKVTQGPYRLMIEMFKIGWIPAHDANWTSFFDKNI